MALAASISQSPYLTRPLPLGRRPSGEVQPDAYALGFTGATQSENSDAGSAANSPEPGFRIVPSKGTAAHAAAAAPPVDEKKKKRKKKKSRRKGRGYASPPPHRHRDRTHRARVSARVLTKHLGGGGVRSRALRANSAGTSQGSAHGSANGGADDDGDGDDGDDDDGDDDDGTSQHEGAMPVDGMAIDAVRNALPSAGPLPYEPPPAY